MSRRRILLINPVGSGLKHYTDSLRSVLIDAGADVAVLTIDEPSASGQNRFQWLWEYCRLLDRARRLKRGAEVIITWPVVGYWDFTIIRFLLGRVPVQVVIHDPEPLVRARGYGWLARWVSRLRIMRAKSLVHSEAAANIVKRQAQNLAVTLLPHPMLAPRKPLPSSGVPIVRVLGQYKQDRDVDSLRKLASDGDNTWRYEIVGRGWKAIPGWEVLDRFVSEDEFDALIGNSSVVLIPYRRFFQSGVAIRCLEMGTPVVGPRASSLESLLRQESRWLVGDESWTRAVEAAIYSDPEEIYQIALGAYTHVLEQWRNWVTVSSAS
jgi:hypothetical protein